MKRTIASNVHSRMRPRLSIKQLLAQKRKAKASQPVLGIDEQAVQSNSQTTDVLLPSLPALARPAYNCSQFAWARHLPAPQPAAEPAAEPAGAQRLSKAKVLLIDAVPAHM
jgi:hypothetical protein